MKCKQCGNNIRVNFSGHCSTSCRDTKPMRIVPNPRYEIVDASVHESEVAPPKMLRSKLAAEFKELTKGTLPVTKEWLDKVSGVLK